MRILNFGSMNIDYVYKVDHIMLRGETQLCESRQVFSGGKGLNQSVALGRAGLTVFHAGNIGAEGGFMLDVLRDSGVDVSLVRVLADTPSGHTVIQNDREGDNCILLFGGANQCATRQQVDTVLSGFEAGDFIVLQNEVSELGYIIECAHSKGMTIVLNPSPMNRRISALPLHAVDYFMLNEVEASQLTGLPTEDADRLLSGILQEFPDARIVLTLGAAGAVYGDGVQTVHQPAQRVAPVDTTAAGDTFTGYFIAGLVKYNDVEQALRLASAAAGIAVTRPGAAPSIPVLEEVLSAGRLVDQ